MLKGLIRKTSQPIQKQSITQFGDTTDALDEKYKVLRSPQKWNKFSIYKELETLQKDLQTQLKAAEKLLDTPLKDITPLPKTEQEKFFVELKTALDCKWKYPERIERITIHLGGFSRVTAPLTHIGEALGLI